MTTFFELHCRHDNEIDSFPELNQVFLSEIFDFLYKVNGNISDKRLNTYLLIVDRLIQRNLLHAIIYLIFHFLAIVSGVFFFSLFSHNISIFSKDLLLDFIPLGLFHLIVSIIFEKVQAILGIEIVI